LNELDVDRFTDDDLVLYHLIDFNPPQTGWRPNSESLTETISGRIEFTNQEHTFATIHLVDVESETIVVKEELKTKQRSHSEL
jgi:hypothetical protein